MKKIEYHMARKALTGEDGECGDFAFIREEEEGCFLALVDAAGHGPTANKITLKAEKCLEFAYQKSLPTIIEELHEGLRGTRGAVAGLVRLERESGSLRYSGMGNICMKIIGGRPQRLMTREGILGYMIPSPREAQTSLFPGDMLIMTSDGIREHFDPDQYPEIFTGSAADITANIIRVLGKNTDDASCIVLRYGI